MCPPPETSYLSRMGSAQLAIVEEKLGVKYDAGKDPWHLLPWDEVTTVVRVLAFGAAKYGADNWKHVDNARDRYFSAALRHLVSWRQGEVVDPESGQPHLAHAVACMLFLMAKEP